MRFDNDPTVITLKRKDDTMHSPEMFVKSPHKEASKLVNLIHADQSLKLSPEINKALQDLDLQLSIAALRHRKRFADDEEED